MTVEVFIGDLTAVEAHRHYVKRLARLGDLEIGTGLSRPDACAAAVVGGSEVFIPLAGMIDLDVERERLRKEIAQKEKFLTGIQGKLRNVQFTSRAPEDVVERERAKERDTITELSRLRANLQELEA